MRSLRTSDGEAGQLDLFVGAGSDIAARDAQDLMAWPFFSLAKSKRVKPIDFRMGEVAILVEPHNTTSQIMTNQYLGHLIININLF